jgi:hypothetical protein
VRLPRSSSSRSKWCSRSTSGSSIASAAAQGVALERDSDAFYALTMGVAEGRIDKPAVAAELKRIRERALKP